MTKGRIQKVINYFLGEKHPQKFQPGDRVSFRPKYGSDRGTKYGEIVSFEQGRGGIVNYYRVCTSFMALDGETLRIGIPETDLTLVHIHTLE